MRSLRLPLLVTLAAVVAACGSDGDDASAPAITDPPLTSVADSVAPPAADTGGAVAATAFEIELADFSYPGLPAELPSGVTRLIGTNTGTEEHQATFFRIKEGETVDSVLAALGTAPQNGYPLLDFFGGPQSVAPSGSTESVVVDLEPGEYVVGCFIPSPSDGVPHAAKGMVQPITVTDSGAEPTAPVPAGETIVMTSYAFEVPEAISGDETLRVVNNGEQPHEVAAYQVDDGADPQEALTTLLSANPTGPPPITPAGGVAAMQPGQVAGIDLQWTPGNYLLVCFLPDATDGAPHFTKGMATKIAVT